MSAEARLRERNITLPASPRAVGNYVNAVQTGSLVFCSGHGPITGGVPMMRGKLGREVSMEEGYRLAREVGLMLLGTLREELGSLDRITRIVKVLGMVSSVEDFHDHPKVINGFSDLMLEVFGEQIGKHARSAIGVAGLPLGIPVEVEMIVEVK